MDDGTDPTATDIRIAQPERTLNIKISGQTIWQVLGAILLTLFALWAMGEMSGLLWMFGISFFFSLALQPAVMWLVDRHEWGCGAAVGVVYLAGFIAQPTTNESGVDTARIRFVWSPEA